MRHIIFIFFLILSTSSFGQIENQINSILLKRDFEEFLEFAKSYDIEKNGVRIDKGNIREIVGGYQEAMFTINKVYLIHNGVSITCNPKLRVITINNRIIYFYLESKEMKGFPENIETTSDTAYSFIDEVKMDDLKRQFELKYQAILNEADLFIDTIAVGIKCGHYPGFFTNEYQQISTWVQQKDTLSVFSWLQSANSEKQVYAVKGVFYLLQRGVKISNEKKAIARQIRQKKGTIYTCIPCDTGTSLISKELEEFSF